MANLLQDAGVGAYNTLYEVVTGRATPGSDRERRERREREIKDRQDRLTLRNLDRELYTKNEPPPRALSPQEQADLGYRNNLRAVNVTRAQNQANLDYIGESSLLGARGRMTSQDISAADAATRNKLAVQGQLYDHQRGVVNDLIGGERALQGGELELADRLTGFAGTENDKRRAFADKRFVPNLLLRLGLVGGLIAAALKN